MKNIAEARADLLAIFQAAIARVNGRSAVAGAVGERQQQLSLVAIGKAAEAMALGVLDRIGDSVVDGLVISKEGHLQEQMLRDLGLESVEGGHPVPDSRSLEAGQKLLAYLAGLPEERALLFLISGGASSLVEVLRPGVSEADLNRVTRWLLGSGLPIEAINLVRRSLSVIKGGGLLNYLGGHPLECLLISDVPGDDPSVVGSGLLAPDPGAPGRLAALDLPEWIRVLCESGGDLSGDSVADPPELRLVATLGHAREAAAEQARQLGYRVKVFHADISGDAETVGRRLALELIDAPPGVYIWGGEPTVRLPPEPGRGGRNQHLALSAARLLAGRDDVCLLSAGTDGTDGPGEDAGALVDGGTQGRGRRRDLDPESSLLAADSGSFLEASGDLLHTGPTGTNVMDLVLGLKLQ